MLTKVNKIRNERMMNRPSDECQARTVQVLPALSPLAAILSAEASSSQTSGRRWKPWRRWLRPTSFVYSLCSFDLSTLRPLDFFFQLFDFSTFTRRPSGGFLAGFAMPSALPGRRSRPVPDGLAKEAALSAHISVLNT